MRWLILLHRYLGIGIGWLVAVWCLSGIVMMYVPYPSVGMAERLAALPPLELEACCAAGAAELLGPDFGVDRFSLEMLLGEPTLSLVDAYGRTAKVQLASGRFVDGIDADEALAVARERSRHAPQRGSPRHLGLIARDQWTVGNYRPGQLLHHIALGDPAGTEWYLSEADAALVQATTARERFWNWVGAVSHWLYPTALRQHGLAWSRVVVWSTLFALFLTLIGLYIGIQRLGRRPAGRVSPYRGMALWHHMLGLAGGLFALTWLLSGLLSMNPWGLLEATGAREEMRSLAGIETTGSEIDALAAALQTHALPAGTTLLRSAPLGGRLYLSAHDRTGAVARLDAATFAPAPLTRAELEQAARRLRPDAAVVAVDWLDGPDAYYYGLHEARSFPVLRIVFDDAEATRYYLDAVTGELLDKADGTRRAYRWLFNALHSLDFAAILRVRPVWDALMIGLLGLVALLSLSGVYLGLRFLAGTQGGRRPWNRRSSTS